MDDLDLDKLKKEIEYQISSTKFDLDTFGSEDSLTDVDDIAEYNYMQGYLKCLLNVQRYIQTIEENEDDNK
jgi:hypothetical protein